MARLLRAPFRLRLHTLAVPSAPALCRRSYSTPTSNNSDNTIATSTTITAEAKTTAPSPVPNSTTSPASRDDQWQGINLLQDAIEFQLGPSKKFKVPFTLLRDACKCPLCVDTHSKQRNFRSSDIPHNITPKSVKWDSNQLETKWNHDIEGFDESHASKYTLRELQYPQVYGQFSSLGRKRPRTLWNRDIMNKHQHWISFDSYINDDEKFTSAMRALATWGLVFVSDIPESREMVEKIATRMGPIRNTFYGATWDVRKVPEARNVAYTNKFLGFHMDLMYMNEPPGFQLLHCIHNSCEGGESLFADTFKVARDLSVHQPDVFQRLTKTHLRYQYIHEDHHYNNTWPVFSTYEDTQVPGDHGLFHVNYSPPFQGPGHWGVPYGDSKGVQRRIADLKTFASRLEEEENTFELKLNPGECVIFENRRIVHARRQFNTNSGERWLAGTYVDEDAIMSRWRMLRNHYPEVWDYESEDVKALNMSQRKRRGEGHHSPSVDN